MAKFLLVCARSGTGVPDGRIRRACELLVPDNVTAAPPEIRRATGLTLAVIHPAQSLPLHETSLCLGQMLGADDGWWAPGREVPDGSFALARSDANTVEIATDAVGTRSVFYVATDDLFIASTSQRAIVAVLGSFRPNATTVSWMLSSGALGPGNSWDERIRRLGADARVVLDRRGWKVTTSHRPVVFHVESRPEKEHLARLSDAVLSACDGVDLGTGEWRLPLSGGYDSRCLLVNLSRRYRLPCITWGVRSAEDDPENDAAIARDLARRVGVPHEFHPMDASSESFEVLLDRFLRNGEGCADHISAYMDGFEVWRHLRETGVTGVVRGDEAFGWVRVTLESTVRPGLEATMLTDYYPRAQIEKLGLAEQSWPAELQQQEGESLATWRDRLYQAYRIPVILASLTDLKVPYVEIVNPLVCRRILEVVRTLPDALRTDKVLFRKLVASITPPVPFAKRSAIPNYGALVRSSAFLELTRREVIAGRDEGSLPAPFAKFVLSSLPRQVAHAAAAQQSRLAWARAKGVAAARAILPLHVRSYLRSLRPHQPAGLIAFRSAIVARMTRMLKEDAASGAAVVDAQRASSS